ncbi:A/G-specific adenine glycosylase [Bifidobacterium actinocoloniiforme DSM 22766]|uniref:Adenine DNA glycosylase n=1 Tax=Bifidobacterium actinocoloniiforme DSM 22766 TaxID=1437605 RepID=A0A086YZF1_9BIFI|nr:A/G-specific adenine glycosylase [Bifidobacterium actinocoloniiforme]AKV54987.1 adenine glycosylase [Bifidobacterium actinocoloniiforme DSM 22766]KFI39651.1 A/G-specific adenine glycosylase [Bifidobacterium actinocoloniiforme DSM 22766]
MTQTAQVELTDARRAYRLLAAWWEGNARDLPWRFGRTTPWGILVSEVMSQQTQMSRVVPYWVEWMRAWPTPEALAAASGAEVITAWGRLGYPRRALRLQACAKTVVEEYGGKLPQDYETLLTLPGVGDYTASAVVSFAYGKRIAVIDTNIRRVLGRVFAGKESRGGAASADERTLAQRALPEDDAESVVWNQSVMELGATVCAAKSPACEECPLNGICAFLAAGRPGLGERRTRPRQRFKGTDRQVRGLILAALRELPPGGSLPISRLDSLWPDQAQLGACLASLDEDGLVEIHQGGSVSLPE